MNFFNRLFGKNPPEAKSAAAVVPLTDEERSEALEQIDEYAARDVAAGFRSESEIVEGGRAKAEPKTSYLGRAKDLIP